jgi:hypothetical protein
MQDEQRAAHVSRLLALTPEDFAREADRLLVEIADEERGRLAGTLIDAYQHSKPENADIVSQLRLDSADPSLMSRRDVRTLLAHVQSHDRQALRRALLALGDAPQPHSTLSGLFAPSRGTSDTSNLGSDPTVETTPQDRLSPR